MITETETAFLAVICAFLTEEKASPAEIQALHCAAEQEEKMSIFRDRSSGF